jgi:hypothetical protein
MTADSVTPLDGMVTVSARTFMGRSIEVVVCPRQVWSWSEFLLKPGPAIALDGMVTGGPRWDEKTLHVNYDHHDGVVREATMSTAMQVYVAIKGGVMDRLGHATVYVNDPDQDTALAVWLLEHHKQFSGVQSHPVISRLLTLTDRWDITGGAFPMDLNDKLVRQHCWVFGPYTDLRKSGALATANASVMENCLSAVTRRLDLYLMGQAEEKELDTRHSIEYASARWNHAYPVFTQGGPMSTCDCGQTFVPQDERRKCRACIAERERDAALAALRIVVSRCSSCDGRGWVLGIMTGPDNFKEHLSCDACAAAREIVDQTDEDDRG